MRDQIGNKSFFVRKIVLSRQIEPNFKQKQQKDSTKKNTTEIKLLKLKNPEKLSKGVCAAFKDP